MKPGETPGTISRRGDYVLLDTFHPELYGGTGQRISLDLLRALDLVAHSSPAD